MNPGDEVLPEIVPPAPGAGEPTLRSPDPSVQLLAELQAGIARRQSAERELARLEVTLDRQAEWRFQQSLVSLAVERDEKLQESEQRLQAERDQLDAQYAAETEAIERGARDAVAASAELASTETARVESRFQENAWLLNSLTDDTSEESPKFQYERLRQQIEQTRTSVQSQETQVQAAYVQAESLLASRRSRLGPLPVSGSVAGTRDELLQQFTKAIQDVDQHHRQLQRLIVPRALVGWTPLWISLAVLGIVFAAVWGLVDPKWFSPTLAPGLEWSLIVGGCAIGFCAVFWLALWISAAQVTADPAESLQQAYVIARTTGQEWQRQADQELKRAEQDAQRRHAAIVERRERTIAKFTTERDEALALIAARRAAELAESAQRQAAALRTAAERHNAALLAVEAAARREATSIRLQHDREAEQRRRRHDVESEQSLQRSRKLQDQCAAGWRETLDQLEARITQLSETGRRGFVDWTDLAQPGWQPVDALPTNGIRLGRYVLPLAEWPGGAPADRELPLPEAPLEWPAVWSFPGGPALLLKGEGAGVPAAIQLLQVAMLRLLAQLPPGAVRFTIFDPVGLGENFAAFMNLADFDDLLITSRIWTEPAQIDTQLSKLTEHMETVFQKYLRNEFESIEEYNRQAGEVAEPYRVLVIAGFPAGFSEKSAQRLISIATKGARCGVATLIACDTRLPRPHGFDFQNLEEAATVLEWNAGRFVNRQLAAEPVEIQPDAPPATTQFVSLIRKLGEVSKDVRRVEVPFQRIVPRPEQYWQEDSRSVLRVPLGRAGATRLQYLQLGKGTSQHVLIAGKTGSGKSTLLNVIITDLALRYSPDEVEFYLIDFKKGVEFKTYATHQLPHARAIAIESDREFGVSVLERLDAVLRERGDLFRAEGVQDIASFRQARPGHPLPRVLLIVDEFQEFFVEDDRYSQQASLLLDRLVRQGRAFGIHVLLGSQTLGGSYSLPRTTIGQMAVRIALQCSEADAHLILSEDNTAARLLTRPGEAIYNDANGLMEGNSPFQVAWLDDPQRDEYLDRVAGLATARGRPVPDQIVFEGNVPADPLRNQAWRQAIESTTADLAETVVEPTPPRSWLGEAVSITGPASVQFHARSGANLLLVGQDSQMALGILANSLATLTIGGTAAAPRRAWLLSGDSLPGTAGRWARLRTVLPNQVEIGGPPDAVRVLGELSEELTRRRESGQAGAAWFLVLDDLARFRDLRKTDDDYGFGGFDRKETESPAQQLGTLLKEGPALGIHVIVWCDSSNNLERWFSRQLLREFEMRVLFPMSAADSSQLIDSPAASRLGVNRAILYSDERGTVEKFRPYGAPGESWLRWLSQRFGGTATAVEVADDINLFSVT